MRIPTLPLCLFATLAVAHPLTAQAEDDPYIWLEEVEGEEALGWATDRSEATLAEFAAMPRFDAIMSETMDILGSQDRIAYPSIRGSHLYDSTRLLRQP